MTGFIQPSPLRPAILDLLKTQSPLHLSAIHARLEAVMGKKLRRNAVSSTLGKMVTEGELRRPAPATYAKVRKEQP